MALFSKYFDTLLKHEGGFVNDPDDRGGATNKGITLHTWRRYGTDLDGDGDIDPDDLRQLTNRHAEALYKPMYWDKIGGDTIRSQPLAEIIFDHAVNAGASRAVKMLQMLLNTYFGQRLAVDGLMGNHTMAALNRANPNTLFTHFKALRQDYYNYLAGNYNGPHAAFFNQSLKAAPNPNQRKFLNGWLNRVKSFTDLVKTNPATALFIGAVILGTFFF